MRKKYSLSDKSILFRILVINIPLLLLLLAIVLANSFYFVKHIQKKAEQSADVFLRSIHEDVEEEKSRLETLMLLCRDNPAFILFLSSTNESIRASYGTQAISQLSLIQYSLPYAKNVFAYSTIHSKFLHSKNGILSTSTFKKRLEAKLVSGEIMPDFTEIKNGFHLFENFALYVQEVNDYGIIAVEMDIQEFIPVIGEKGLVPYNYTVLNREGRIFLSSLQQDEYAMVTEYQQDSSRSDISHLNSNYQVMKRTDLMSGFEYILFYNMKALSTDYTIVNSISIGTIFVIMLLCSLLILGNTTMYRPLQNIVQAFSTETVKQSTGNEISIIERGISQLALEKQALEDKVDLFHTIQFEIALKDLALAGKVPEISLMSLLQERYPQFMLLLLIIQSETNDSVDSQWKYTDQYIANAWDGHGISVDPFTKGYVIPAHCLETQLSQGLEHCFAQDRSAGIVFASQSDLYENITQMHDAFAQCQQRARSISFAFPFSKKILLWEKNMTALEQETMSPDVQNMVANAVLNATPDGIQEIFHGLFFPTDTMTLGTLINTSDTLFSLIPMVASIANVDVKHEMASNTNKQMNYHPSRMYETILSDFLMIHQQYEEKKNFLKYNISEYIEEHYAQDLSLNFLADVYHITPSYLSHWFKKNIGQNITEYIADVRIRIAKELLKTEKTTKVADISAQVGFYNVMTFIRQFKAIVGMTPGQYRTQHQKNAVKEGLRETEDDC